MVENEEGEAKGPSKKIKALLYGPFEILEKVGDNAYKLSLFPYMCIYLAMNLDNLNSFSLPCYIRKRNISYL